MTATGDPARLHQVLANLLANARTPHAARHHGDHRPAGHRKAGRALGARRRAGHSGRAGSPRCSTASIAVTHPGRGPTGRPDLAWPSSPPSSAPMAGTSSSRVIWFNQLSASFCRTLPARRRSSATMREPARGLALDQPQLIGEGHRAWSTGLPGRVRAADWVAPYLPIALARCPYRSYGGWVPRIPESLRALIEGGALAHVATINPDGSPQVTVVWVGWDGDDLVSGHLGLNRKVRNARRDPRVVVSLEAPRVAGEFLTAHAVLTTNGDRRGGSRLGTAGPIGQGLHGSRCAVPGAVPRWRLRAALPDRQDQRNRTMDNR